MALTEDELVKHQTLCTKRQLFARVASTVTTMFTPKVLMKTPSRKTLLKTSFLQFIIILPTTGKTYQETFFQYFLLF